GRELVAVFAFDLGVREELHHRTADGARLALLHGAHLPQPGRVRPRWHAALVLRSLCGSEAGAGDVSLCAVRARAGAGAAQAGAQAGPQLDGGVVSGALALRIEMGTLFRDGPAGVPASRRL